jgi:hypothetical protein
VEDDDEDHFAPGPTPAPPVPMPAQPPASLSGGVAASSSLDRGGSDGSNGAWVGGGVMGGLAWMSNHLFFWLLTLLYIYARACVYTGAEPMQQI